MQTPGEWLNQHLTTVIGRLLDQPEWAPGESLVVPASQSKFGDFQCNIALGLAKSRHQKPRDLALEIIENLQLDERCEPPTIAGPGFINFTLKPAYIQSWLTWQIQDPRCGVPKVKEPETIIVDFSSPNIAKEMHVGHLRSTIIGDCLARLFEFQGHQVLRLNHVGDWGTQFGMLIAYLREGYPEFFTQNQGIDLGDLVSFYRQAKQRFDGDEEFQNNARQIVVQLQAGDPELLTAWRFLCDLSRREFQQIYNLLDVQLTERGESFYNPFLPEIVQELKNKNLAVLDQGAWCVFGEGFTNVDGSALPLIIQKSDGGYNYATTDLAALRYRVQKDGAQKIIYITDVGQSQHFAQVFQVAKKAGWLPETVQCIHVPFGLVLGEDGKKFRTRSGETVRLKDLLEEAIRRAEQDIVARLHTEERQETPEFIQNLAQVIGISAVKYADLSQNRLSNYSFSYDKMLALQGNTAPYLLYAYVRVQGIARKGEINFAEFVPEFVLLTETELTLAKHLMQFPDVVEQMGNDLLPNRLGNYLFELSQKFNQFYDQCPILAAPDPERTSRLGLAHLTAKVLRLGLSLLGIPVVERM
ncbi:arginyl-tRNA synthetase [Gloeomargarita lithophora Alchichica-D10]|uniref:Arginine--tRNA ligase n=1 Tax=Gloeomargarita lithophora Alchichica-D10 TaxID=1188229 RepID=A0A1J0AAL6_9CYAN|nr:arginine--tRNA ligase [Gloeomargarita lithophora]APB32974.1 arginyl-tRNA synthetase [Gloeomargarita lithophora Alchichica-D10]